MKCSLEKRCAVVYLCHYMAVVIYHATTSYICTSSILKSSYKQSAMSWMTIQWAALVCHCAMESFCLLCFIVGGITAASFEFWAFCTNATPATPSCTGFSWLLTLCVWWLLYMPFMGSQIMLGVLILECGFQALPGQWVRLDLYIYYTKS